MLACPKARAFARKFFGVSVASECFFSQRGSAGPCLRESRDSGAAEDSFGIQFLQQPGKPLICVCLGRRESQCLHCQLTVLLMTHHISLRDHHFPRDTSSL